MAGKKTIARIYLEELCKKFPNHADLTLAKKGYKEHPEMFKDAEHARDFIRVIRGHHGKRTREDSIDKSQYKPVTNNYTPYNLPESHADNYEPFIIDQSRTLILSDLHFPYQHNKAIELALDYGI